MLKRLLLLAFVLCCGVAMAAPARWIEHPEWRDEFTSRGLDTGTAVVYDEAADTWHVYDRQRAQTPLLPASTFKLFNALVGLETGAVRDEHEITKWDGVKRWNPDWNQDTDLALGMKNSTVWFYQAMARRIGETRMQAWIDKAGYGNRDIGGGIDQFWLGGKLRISAVQQIDFLRRLAASTLPFSARSQEIVRRISIVEQEDGGVLHGKTGWKSVEGEATDYGWFVGWRERGGKRLFVAVNMDWSAVARMATDGPKRLAIAKAVLQRLDGAAAQR